jgi:hypothetical protein
MKAFIVLVLMAIVRELYLQYMQIVPTVLKEKNKAARVTKGACIGWMMFQVSSFGSS